MKRLILTIGMLSIIALGAAGPSCVTASQQAAILDARVTKQFCDTFTQMTYSGKLDSQLTKDQIKVFNQKRNAFCK